MKSKYTLNNLSILGGKKSITFKMEKYQGLVKNLDFVIKLNLIKS